MRTEKELPLSKTQTEQPSLWFYSLLLAPLLSTHKRNSQNVNVFFKNPNPKQQETGNPQLEEKGRRGGSKKEKPLSTGHNIQSMMAERVGKKGRRVAEKKGK